MPRRPRNETRDRHRERRRNKRREAWEAFKRAFEAEMRKHIHDYFRELREDYERTRERIEFFRDVIRRRSAVLYKVTTYRVLTRTVREYKYDKFIMDLREDVREEVINALLAVSRMKGIDPRILEKYPWIIAFFRYYIAYYKKYPCKHNAFAIKITPLTIRILGGIRVTYYVLRWSPAKHAKADAFLGRTRPVSFFISFFRYKYDDDLINSLLASGEGTCDWNDPIVVARDDKGDPMYIMPLRRAILQSHWIKYYFAKQLGMPEKYYDVDHCSVYVIVERRIKRIKEYESRRRYIFGVRPRHRIKEILYIMGLRR